MGGSPHITLCFFIRLQKFVLDLTKCFFTPPRSRNESFSIVAMEIFFFLFSTVYCILYALAFIFPNLLRDHALAFFFTEWRSMALPLYIALFVGIQGACFFIVFSLSFLHDTRAQERINPSIILRLPPSLFIYQSIKGGLQIRLHQEEVRHGNQRGQNLSSRHDMAMVVKLQSRSYVSVGDQQKTQTLSSQPAFQPDWKLMMPHQGERIILICV